MNRDINENYKLIVEKYSALITFIFIFKKYLKIVENED